MLLAAVPLEHTSLMPKSVELPAPDASGAATGNAAMQWKTAIWKVPAYALAALCALIIAWVTLLAVLPWWVLYSSDIRAGNTIIANVEQFRREHGHLPDKHNPDEVAALGFELRVDYYPDYRHYGDEYEIEYFEGFDGPFIIYSSKLKEWRYEIAVTVPATEY
jgi:hypothetical protein